MRTLHYRFSTIVAFGIIGLLCVPEMATAASDVAQIRGRVNDSSGTPVAGALVVVDSASPIIPDRIALTDKWGSFTVNNLFPGAYSVRVTMTRFLPAMKGGIRLNAGGAAVLTVSLQNALDVVRRAVSRDRAKAEDITWTLRSSRSTQPILRLAEQQPDKESSPQVPDYSGYFQLYSRSVDTSYGISEGKGSQFSITMPLAALSQVTFAGQYTEIPTQPRGFGAMYEFAPADRHRASIGVNARQGALVGATLPSEALREVQIKYGEDFQWSDHLVFNYGAEVGRADGLSIDGYIRPRFGISWVPQARTTLTIAASSQAPASADDPIRGKEYFDRAFYVPPTQERYSHTEASLNHVFSEKVEVGAALFRDHRDTEALFVSVPGGRQGVLILNSKDRPSQGFRLHLNRQFRGFEAGVAYTAADGIGLVTTSSLDQMGNQLVPRRFQVVAARFKAEVDMTQTEVTAIYRWVSNFSASHIDPYQQMMEYNDPTLSLTIAQNLPTGRIFPRKVQAILDARNLFEQSFGSDRTQVVQYPRLVKGGINIKF